MLNAERREAIKDKITNEKRVLIKELCETFKTSPVTIRKDLDFLEEEGILSRVHGGGILKHALSSDLTVTEKEKIHLKEKERIACYAVTLIKEGDVVILDSGFTAVYIARKLKLKKGITIITGGLNIANEIAGSDNELIILGGVFSKDTYAFSGNFAEHIIKNTVADKLFLGVDGVDMQMGLTAYNYEEARLNRLMMKVAAKTILIADSSKFGKKQMGFIGKINEIDLIITDKKIDNKYINTLKKLNTKIHLV